MDRSETQAGCGHPRAGTRSRTWTDLWRGWERGQDVVKDCFRTGRGRGLGQGPRPVGRTYGANIPRPNRDHFADAEAFIAEGVGLALVKSLQVKATKGITLRQIRW